MGQEVEVHRHGRGAGERQDWVAVEPTGSPLHPDPRDPGVGRLQAEGREVPVVERRRRARIAGRRRPRVLEDVRGEHAVRIELRPGAVEPRPGVVAGGQEALVLDRAERVVRDRGVRHVRRRDPVHVERLPDRRRRRPERERQDHVARLHREPHRGRPAARGHRPVGTDREDRLPGVEVRLEIPGRHRVEDQVALGEPGADLLRREDLDRHGGVGPLERGGDRRDGVFSNRIRRLDVVVARAAGRRLPVGLLDELVTVEVLDPRSGEGLDALEVLGLGDDNRRGGDPGRRPQHGEIARRPGNLEGDHEDVPGLPRDDHHLGARAGGRLLALGTGQRAPGVDGTCEQQGEEERHARCLSRVASADPFD